MVGRKTEKSRQIKRLKIYKAELTLWPDRVYYAFYPPLLPSLTSTKTCGHPALANTAKDLILWRYFAILFIKKKGDPHTIQVSTP